MAQRPPHDWKNLEAFEEAHKQLERHEGLESMLIREKYAIPLDDHAAFQRVGIRLAQCKRNILHWTAMVKTADAQLRRDYRN